MISEEKMMQLVKEQIWLDEFKRKKITLYTYDMTGSKDFLFVDFSKSNQKLILGDIYKE